jgi:hypothetical protein
MPSTPDAPNQVRRRGRTVTTISRRFWRKPRCRDYRCACSGDWLDVPYIPGNRQGDRSELVALRRLGTVEDCAKVIEFLARPICRLRHRGRDPD